MPKPKDRIKKWLDPKSRDIFTRIIEDLYKRIGKSEDVSKDQYLDLSREFSTLKDDLEKKTAPPKISKTDILPIPENLNVWDLFTLGITHVNPSLGTRLRYFGKIKGYEFYGSPNSGFEPHLEPYLQSGYHFGVNNVQWLYTENTDDQTETFVLDGRLVGKTIAKVYQQVIGTATSGSTGSTLKDSGASFASFMVGRTIRNTTDESSGVISAVASGTELTAVLSDGQEDDWDEGDDYIIYNREGTITGWGTTPKYRLRATDANSNIITWEKITGAGTAGCTGSTLIDSGASFDDSILGRNIRNETDGSTGTVSGVASGTELTAVLTGGTGNDWEDGDDYRIYDKWIIKEYPRNRLFNFGPFAVFPKRLGDYYVLARTVGKDRVYSPYTSETQSVGWSSSAGLMVPIIMFPVHSCGSTCTMVEGYPVCPTHGSVTWDEITGGSRETDHFHFFGAEYCKVEIVLEVEDKPGPWYEIFKAESTSSPE